jgi:predicted TIM-barrel fold metal-dependent hydrolase
MNRIDVHAHVLPPTYRSWLESRGITETDGRELPSWSPAEHLEVMDRNGIATSILSLSTPGSWVEGRTDALEIANTVNEYCATLTHEHPDRFGFFANAPLPDVDAALAATTHALDDLGADGVSLLANNNGSYLGDPAFDPLLAELDRRAATVLVHPSSLCGPAVPGIPPFAVDFLLDTTRAVVNLVLHDVPRRFPNLKLILSHAGGFLPYAAYRIGAVVVAQTGREIPEILESLSSFYFDTALSSSPTSLPSLLAFAKPGHVLFGSDWPWAPELALSVFSSLLDGHELPPTNTLDGINRKNAEKLFPRLRPAEDGLSGNP